MKIYITKFALTKGIYLVDTDQLQGLKATCGASGDLTFTPSVEVGATVIKTVAGGDWFRDWDSAVADAQRKRDVRVNMLIDQTLALQQLTFDRATPVRTCSSPKSYYL